MSNNISESINQWKSQNKGLISAYDGTVYIDNPTVPLNAINYERLTPVLDANAWNEAQRSKSASIQNDPLSLTDVFIGEFGDLANDMLSDIQEAKQSRDRSKAAAVITSQDYSILQDAIAIGETTDVVKTGILTNIFETINIPNYKGEWFDWDDAVEFHLNVAEGKAVEPSKGAVTSVEYTVPKHMGGVAITEYAQAMINAPNGTGNSIFNRLVQAMQQQRLKKENGLVATELEAATDVDAGIDFGARASGVSSNNPEALWISLTDIIDTAGGTFNSIASKSQAYNEAINNDFLKGHEERNNNPTYNEQAGPAPGLTGVTWYRDNAISSATKLWAFDRNRAAKIFRAGLRSFQLTDPKHETTEWYLKSFMIPKIVDQTFIVEVTGVTA